jgi:hypothetical protein
MSDPAPSRRDAFTLKDGGPFHRVLARLRSRTGGHFAPGAALALFAWAPMALGEGVRVASGRPLETTFTDLAAHTRLLVAIPMMLLAERLVEAGCNSGLKSLYAGRFCDPAAIDSVVTFGERWRTAAWPEALLALLSLLNGQLALWRVTGATGVFHGGEAAAGWSFPQFWYTVVALPLSTFLMSRWLWRWAVWAAMLTRLSRLPLNPIATHPDLAAGLSCVARPLSGFAGYAFALGSVLAGVWGTKLLAGRTTVEAELPAILGFILAMVAIAIAPLLPFSLHLYKVRRRELASYGDFANAYMRGFDAKWIRSKSGGEEALGASDIQSLADIGNAYSVINRTRLFVFGWRPLVGISFGALLPMLPLLASTMTVEDVLKRIFSGVLGGLPL